MRDHNKRCHNYSPEMSLDINGLRPSRDLSLLFHECSMYCFDSRAVLNPQMHGEAKCSFSYSQMHVSVNSHIKCVSRDGTSPQEWWPSSNFNLTVIQLYCNWACLVPATEKN